jgi:hypothetical protein
MEQPFYDEISQRYLFLQAEAMSQIFYAFSWTIMTRR